MFVEYGKLSTMVYEMTKPVGKSLDGDIEYYYEQLKNTKGLILEAGVGTGRMLIPLIQKGLNVEGVDLSEEMLEQCHLNMAKNDVEGHVFQGDLTKLDISTRYEVIMMPTGSFCLLPKAIIEEVLKSFFNHLTDEGQLILDIELPMWFKSEEVSVSDFTLSADKGILFTSVSKNMDWHEQKVSYIHRYELVEKGVVTETELSHFTLYWYGIDEFRRILEAAGFSHVTYKVGYERDESASLVTFFARKNG